MKNEMRLINICEKVWYGRNKLYYPLIPLSLIYLVVVRVRRKLLSIIYRNRRLPVPAIIVGGISIGGTGKTPLVIALSKWLKKQGYRPGIISRGYRGKRHSLPYTVSRNSDPTITGDEPLLIRQKTKRPTVVFRDRYAAAMHLLEQHENVDIILADDGLQHYALPRDIEIAVIDGERHSTNTWPLPAGPLRESAARLAETDFIIVKESMNISENESFSIESDKKEMDISPRLLRNLESKETVSLDHFYRKEAYAVAAIANPQNFFDTLEQLGIKTIPYRFPDHYYFNCDDFELAQDLPIIVTEKDAVKCAYLPKKRIRRKIWVLETEVILNEQFLKSLLQKIEAATESATKRRAS